MELRKASALMAIPSLGAEEEGNKAPSEGAAADAAGNAACNTFNGMRACNARYVTKRRMTRLRKFIEWAAFR
jgi:hypothetical protein